MFGYLEINIDGYLIDIIQDVEWYWVIIISFRENFGQYKQEIYLEYIVFGFVVMVIYRVLIIEILSIENEKL